MELNSKFRFKSGNADNVRLITSDAKGNRPELSISIANDSLGELAQAKVRCILNIALMVLALIAYSHNPHLGLPRVWYTFIFTASSAGFLYFWALLISKAQIAHKWRITQRIFSILLDNIAITWILHFGGEALAGIFGIYLWITVGYGMRFGLNYLYINLAASLIGFTVGVYFTEFWRAHLYLAMGLGFALLIVPLYSAFLIKRLHEVIWVAKAAYQAKSDFVAKMSHELRTPLHGIISTTDLLARTSSSPQQKEMIRIISVSSNTLLDLINRILDISKFEAGTFTLQQEPMDLHVVMNDTVNILWPQANHKALLFHVYTDISIENHLIGAHRQLQEVLINLCGNAVKFTDSGRVSLRALYDSETKDDVSINFEISDSGPGIPEEYIDRLFDPFVQADNSVTRKHGGTGLGTAIAKELVNLMGGEISVQSARGVGTTFKFRITFSKNSQQDGHSQIFPINLICLGFDSILEQKHLIDMFSPYGPKLFFQSGFENLSDFRKDDAGIGAILVNVNTYEAELPSIVKCISTQLGGALMPIAAYGENENATRIINAGFHSLIGSKSSSIAVARMLNLSMNLRKEYLPQKSSASSNRPLRILVAEDNPTNQTIARIALKDAGHESLIVDNGQDALDELLGGNFDVAIIDMHMPVMDGIEVSRLYGFSELDPERRIPIIMMTADNRAEVIADAEMAGIDKFLVKPLRPAVLIDAVHKVYGARVRSVPSSTSSDVDFDFSFKKAETESTGEDQLIDLEIVEELLAYMAPSERDEFFREFFEDASNYISQFMRLSDTLDLNAIRRDMHALCGAARTVGAVKLAKRARKYEYMQEELLRSNSESYGSEMGSLLEDTFSELRVIAGRGC